MNRKQLQKLGVPPDCAKAAIVALTRAAEEADMSYRHAWNLIEKWSAFFEVPLVDDFVQKVDAKAGLVTLRTLEGLEAQP